jgi:hypothetical protein
MDFYRIKSDNQYFTISQKLKGQLFELSSYKGSNALIKFKLRNGNVIKGKLLDCELYHLIDIDTYIPVKFEILLEAEKKITLRFNEIVSFDAY